MILLNSTQAFVGLLPQDDTVLGRHVDVIVKCTYSMDETGALTPLPQTEQPWPQGDVTYQDDLGNSVRYPMDVGPPRLYTDLIVTGTAWQPDGRREEILHVGIALGQWSKHLIVHGDREWRSNGLGELVMTPASTFTSMPLRYELAFGGLGDWRNPVGRGIEPLPGSPPDDPVIPLPNIESPLHPIRTPEDRPPPAGFGPIPMTWEPRASRVGTRDTRWALFEAPKAPKDQDPRYHQAAPDDQILERLRGDETVVLSNLHPTRRLLEVALPGQRPRFFVVKSDDVSRSLIEVPLTLDLVAIDTDAMTTTLLWRQRVEHDWEQTIIALRYLWATWDRVDSSRPMPDLQAQFAKETEVFAEALEIAAMTPDQMVEKLGPAMDQEAFKAAADAGITPEELEAFKALKSLEERQAFIETAVRREIATLDGLLDQLTARFGAVGPPP